MLIVAGKTHGVMKNRYTAVGMACLSLFAFLILQVLSVAHPFYAMGLIIAICTVHSFVEMDERKEKRIYDSIARALAEDYAAMYYINIETGEYREYITSEQYKNMNIPVEGRDFYGESLANIETFVYEEDRELARGMYSKDVMLQNMEGRTTFSYKYRIMVEGEPRFFLFTLKISADGQHFILYEKDIEADIRAEAEHIRALHAEKELARKDALTGVKNKNAYKELERSVQENIDNGLDYLTFALIVCDANNLKKINDTEGHVAGDEYIKSSAKMLCDIFVHSPVFRVGGDEFVVFLRSEDFTHRDALMKKLRNRVEHNLKTGQRPILASGMADFLPGYDTSVSEIFARADKEMYENKQKLKEEE
jgi:diguanylate cyclase (GGDEF)-like protein